MFFTHFVSFKDFFSKQSAQYTQFRPKYPNELYTFILKLVPNKKLAWDVGTGNGQAAIDLVRHFESILATDASKAQIEKTKVNPKIRYAVMPAEKSDLDAESVDLVTVAQALHWFNFDLFFKEVNRVLKPNGVFATWAYGFHQSSDSRLNSIINKFGKEILAEYWQPEPKMIWNDYRAIKFPFRMIDTPKLNLTVKWNLAEIIGFFSTWSATQKYIDEKKSNPIEIIYEDLLRTWGDPNQRRKLDCPLIFKVGCKE